MLPFTKCTKPKIQFKFLIFQEKLILNNYYYFLKIYIDWENVDIQILHAIRLVSLLHDSHYFVSKFDF